MTVFHSIHFTLEKSGNSEHWLETFNDLSSIDHTILTMSLEIRKQRRNEKQSFRYYGGVLITNKLVKIHSVLANDLFISYLWLTLVRPLGYLTTNQWYYFWWPQIKVFSFHLAFNEMKPEKQADLLLLGTVAVFVFLTIVAFLMNEGKDMVVRPVYHKIQKTLSCGRQQSQDLWQAYRFIAFDGNLLNR